MSQFRTSWELCRKRFLDELEGLSDQQLLWKLYPGSLSIGEMALHVAGVEVLFASQLRDLELDEFSSLVRRSATEGVVDDLPFPFAAEEITSPNIARAFARALEMVKPMMDEPGADLLSKQIKSALGPIITGEGALARLAFHPAYHQGQAYQLKNSPEFPS